MGGGVVVLPEPVGQDCRDGCDSSLKVAKQRKHVSAVGKKLALSVNRGIREAPP